jgi:hypothetical protein
MGLAGVLHHLVDNSPAFDGAGKVRAHKDISEHFSETERHHMVPSPEAEKASADERAAERAGLEARLRALDDGKPEEPGEPEEP